MFTKFYLEWVLNHYDEMREGGGGKEAGKCACFCAFM